MTAADDAVRLWAILFAAGRPVARSRLGEVLGWPEGRLLAAAEALTATLEATAAPVTLERVGRGLQLVLRPEHHALARALLGEAPARLSEAALETLALVAYMQPVSRATIEAARGVRAERSLAHLTDRSLVREAPAPRGANGGDGPWYVTTGEFLVAFGLAALSDLPPWPGPSPLVQAALTLTPAATGEDGRA